MSEAEREIQQDKRRGVEQTCPKLLVAYDYQALGFEDEALNCCHNGKVSLPLLSNYSFPLKEHLKVDSMVMMLRNLSLRQGLCNGTRLKVTNLHQKQQFFRAKTEER